MTRYKDESYVTVDYGCDGFECAAKLEITYRETETIKAMSEAAQVALDDALLEKAMVAIGWKKRDTKVRGPAVRTDYFCVDCQKEDRIPK